jgi:TRAP-type C4-dicarboxylate transport system permease small subunit
VLTWKGLRKGYERLLECIVVLLMVLLTALVIAGAFFRYIGSALSWYDEVASIGLVWLTYYGAALAALRGAHIGVASVVNALPPKLRLLSTIFAEAVVIAFFIVLAITGVQVVLVLAGEHLVSLPSVPTQLTQSVIPVGAVLFIVAELLRMPDTLRAAAGSGFGDSELEEVLAHRSGDPEPVQAGGAE